MLGDDDPNSSLSARIRAGADFGRRVIAKAIDECVFALTHARETRQGRALIRQEEPGAEIILPLFFDR